MGIEAKYGQVTTEHGSIGVDEPVVLFRSQDELLPTLLEVYIGLCEAAGSPDRHLQMLRATRDKVIAWQTEHPTKTPDSESSRAWLEPTDPV